MPHTISSRYSVHETEDGVPHTNLFVWDFRVESRRAARTPRFYGCGDLHFITFSCYRRLPFLATWSRRDMFLRALEKVAREYRVGVVGYVVMPEHIHLLLSEPERDDLSTVIKALKQSVSRRVCDRGGARPRKPDCSPIRLPVASGKRASTTSMSGRPRSASKSCATCIAIR